MGDFKETPIVLNAFGVARGDVGSFHFGSAAFHQGHEKKGPVCLPFESYLVCADSHLTVKHKILS